MKKSSMVLMIAGIVMMILSPLIFSHLNHINAVDSHTWTININGIRSFSWLSFSGAIFLSLGIIFFISSWEKKGRRIN